MKSTDIGSGEDAPSGGAPKSCADSHGRSLELESVFLRNYGQAQYAFVQMLTEHLADLSRVFEGDLQEMLVLSVVGQAFLEALTRGVATGTEARSSVTASRIADVCGIPRQTVRRKLARLQERNWIEQGDDQSWRIKMDTDDSFARKALADIDRRGIARAARFYARLERIAALKPK